MEVLRGMHLPPGFGFHPTDPELISHYLKRKILGQEIEYDLIPEVDIYKHEPWDLPAKCNLPIKDNKWHFFASRDRKYPTGSSSNRVTIAGYWKSTGKDRVIKLNKRTLGTKKTLVFHEGRPPFGKHTEWIMHEYYIDENECKVSPDMKDSFVLCCVTKRNDWALDNDNEVVNRNSHLEQLDAAATSVVSTVQPEDAAASVICPEESNHATTTVGSAELSKNVAQAAITPDSTSPNGGDEMDTPPLFDDVFLTEQYDDDSLLQRFHGTSPEPGPRRVRHQSLDISTIHGRELVQGTPAFPDHVKGTSGANPAPSNVLGPPLIAAPRQQEGSVLPCFTFGSGPPPDVKAEQQGEMSSTLGIIEFPTSSSLGAMGPLLRKLDLLLDSENQLIQWSAKEAIKLLKEELEEINADLVELTMVQHPNYKIRYWMQEVRELSYHIEDCIDNMQSRPAAKAKVRFSVRRPQLRIRRRVKIHLLPKTVQPSARIAELRTLLWEARERHERYQLQDCVSEPKFLFAWNSRTPASSSSGAGANLVGVDGTRGKLTSWLIDNEQMEAEQQQLKVLSILGSAGVGKTALVKELYHQLGHQFECRAFVRVSRNPDMRRLLGEILAQVQGCERDYDEYEAASTANNLIDSIRSHLQDKRYFVVIDELWDAAAWDIMNIAFPKGNNCSRIIITAEGKDVASKCYCVSKLEMAPLGNLHDSGKIFFGRVFVSERQCPDQLKDISWMIIRSCGGFPLAITTIASLLASQIGNTELWDYLQKCFVFRLTGVTLEETCKEVVNICCDALPQDLKTCLLYLTMYPEGSTIRKADLLNQWIAEGFITPKEENQTVAESYFAELINRGMIQPEKIDHNDEVLSCTVHHIVFDVIAQKSREENFITAVDYSQTMLGFSTITRRLSLHFSCAQFAAKPEGLKKLSQVRSLAFYGLLKCMPSITKFKFIRVLILEFWGDNYHHTTSLDLSKLCILFHLRYLKVSSHTIIILPSQIQKLQSLETLEIHAQVTAVPTDILHLPALLHLSLPNGTELPDGIGRITSLETLEHFDLGSNSEDNAQSLGELINLQNLHVTCSKALSDHHLKRNLVALSSSVGRLANLKSLRVGPCTVGMAMFVDQDVISCAPELERLDISPFSCIFSRLPTWIGELQKLCILKIAVRVLLISDIDTLTGLPVLAVLSLYVQKPNAECVVFNSGSLPALKYFKYRCAALRLAFEKEALPNLQRLKLCFNVHRVESYTSNLAGIENLLKLKDITAEIGAAAGAHESDRRAAESALKEATRKHPRFPIHMNVKSVDCIEEESTPVEFMHPIPYILRFLALAVVVVVLIMLFWY